jgi:hypothetical protein
MCIPRPLITTINPIVIRYLADCLSNSTTRVATATTSPSVVSRRRRRCISSTPHHHRISLSMLKLLAIFFNTTIKLWCRGVKLRMSERKEMQWYLLLPSRVDAVMVVEILRPLRIPEHLPSKRRGNGDAKE